MGEAFNVVLDLHCGELENAEECFPIWPCITCVGGLWPRTKKRRGTDEGPRA
jgi:hypothetical protein